MFYEASGVMESSISQKIPVGVVGCGFFGKLHAEKYAAAPEAHLVGLHDAGVGVAQGLAEHQGVEVFTRLEDLAARIEAVSIVAPACHHYELASFFLRSGVHVLVEKPIALSLAHADELIALAEENNLVLQVGHQERFVFADFGLLAREGAPQSIEVCRAGPFTGRSMDVSVVFDLMMHDLDLLHQVVSGRIVSVEASGQTVHGEHQDEVKATLCFDDGCVAALLASRVRPQRQREMKLDYADGVIEIDFINRWIKNSTGADLKSAFVGDASGQSIADDPLGYSIGAFLDSIGTGKPPVVTGQDARRALETALMISAKL